VSSLLSLASPHVILVEYGALTLALHSQSKIPNGYQMVIQRWSSLKRSGSIGQVYPESTVPMEYGDSNRRYKVVSAMFL